MLYFLLAVSAGPWQLTVTVHQGDHWYRHTERYEEERECQESGQAVLLHSALIPDIRVEADCEFNGFTI